MTNHKTLTEKDRNEIIRHYETGQLTQTDLATHYWVSRRTIGRVLRDAGLTAPLNVVTTTEMLMIGHLRKYNVEPNTLRVLLKIAYPEVK